MGPDLNMNVDLKLQDNIPHTYTLTWNQAPLLGIAGFMKAAKKYAVGTSQTQARYIRMPAWLEGKALGRA